MVAALVFGARTALSSWVDLLWFRSLGYSEVFWRSLLFQWVTFGAFALGTFVLLYGAARALARVHRFSLPSDRQIVVGGQPVRLSVQPVLRVLTVAASLLVAAIAGSVMMSEWPALALLVHAPARLGPADPVLGRSLSFFLFTLPAWQLLAGWMLAVAVVAGLFAVLFVLLSGSTPALGESAGRPLPPPLGGISGALSAVLAVLALQVYLGRYDRLLDRHTIFEGATYTDVHVAFAGLLVVSLALLLGAALAAVNAARGARARGLIVAVLPAAAAYVLVTLISWYVGNFIVKPNELVRERPYIGYNIQATRRAYGLDRFLQREFPAETTVDATDPANNQPTFQNIRLWDWHALQDTLRQVQEIRTYYDFPDIDIDRYTIGGAEREVMLATRELNVEKLPESSRNWINEKLVYTHGYGITMNPVNGFTPEGLPTLILSNMPVQSTVPEIAVTRPEIYFGELTDTDVYVKTRQQEFDYPQGATNSLTSYQGNGGIPLGGFLRRVALAVALDDLSKLPFSDDVGAESRLLMRRNVRVRVAALAPFLTFDQDPYMVVGEDGRLTWMIDAFTTSDSYPYSAHSTLAGDSINYMRNSVKVAIDAYDGTTTFYAFDTEDPILMAWRRIFPTLFRDASAMPAELRKHVRYPELLFKRQAEIYGLYHMTDPAVFFNREDLWTLATESTSDSSGAQAAAPMQPNFVLMKLPGEAAPEFVEVLPFTPANRNNLIGWIAGRSDGAAYGTSIVYNFPKTRLVDGPQQIEARIDQNAQLSGQLTLWNQQGSHVHRGSLLVIPSGRALLYAEPIYLQAQQSPMPELRLVVLALQDRLAYGPTFQAALRSLFGGETSSLTGSEAPQAATAAATTTARSPANGAPAGDQNALIVQAARDFDDYQRLTAQGRLSEAGQKLDDLKRTLDRLNTHAK